MKGLLKAVRCVVFLSGNVPMIKVEFIKLNEID